MRAIAALLAACVLLLAVLAWEGLREPATPTSMQCDGRYAGLTNLPDTGVRYYGAYGLEAPLFFNCTVRSGSD